jgi:argininosuccinate synthase
MRIVLAYSGSLEGSAAIQWLRDHHAAEIVGVTLDLGQGRQLEAIRDRALALGAQRAHVLDAREQFAHEFILPALRADALHDGGVPMALALSRPLIAQKLVEIAGIERADAVAHTGGSSGEASPLDRLLVSIAPGLRVLTPAQDSLTSSALDAFARRFGLRSASDDPARVESNLWGRSGRGARSDAPVPFHAASQVSEPTEPALMDITFAHGIPTALNGVVLPLTELVVTLGMLASTHGVGRSETAGLMCEAPAAVLLHAAHRELTRAAVPDAGPFSQAATAAYVDAIEQARWFSPLREALDAYFLALQSRVNGHVRLRLSRDNHSIITTKLAQPSSKSAASHRVLSSHA